MYVCNISNSLYKKKQYKLLHVKVISNLKYSKICQNSTPLLILTIIF